MTEIQEKIDFLEQKLNSLIDDFEIHDHEGVQTRAVDYSRLLKKPISNSNVLTGNDGQNGWEIVKGVLVGENVSLDPTSGAEIVRVGPIDGANVKIFVSSGVGKISIFDSTPNEIITIDGSATSAGIIAVSIPASGTARGIRLINNNTGDSTDLLSIIIKGNGSAVNITDDATNNLAATNLIEVVTNSSNGSRPAGSAVMRLRSIYNGSALILTTGSSSNGYPLILQQDATVTPGTGTFKKIATFGGAAAVAVTLWISDGTNTPNGNLTGSAGDICFGADSGKAYYCTGTTNWTAM